MRSVGTNMTIRYVITHIPKTPLIIHYHKHLNTGSYRVFNVFERDHFVYELLPVHIGSDHPTEEDEAVEEKSQHVFIIIFEN